MKTFHLSSDQRDQFVLNAFRTNRHDDFPPHSHDFTELAIVFAGCGIHVGSEGEEYSFRAGDVFVIEPGAVHSYRATRGLAIANIMFDAKGVRLPDHDLRQLPGFHALFHLEPSVRRRQAGRLRLNPTDLKMVERQVDRLLGELAERIPGYQSLSTAILTELIVFLSRRLEGADARGRNTQAIGRALSYIERHYPEPLTLKNMASQAGMSIRNFQRRFRESVGVTPFRWLLETRVGHAKALLRDPALNVGQVAFRTGFRDSNYFCRQFRSVEGLTPGEYARRGR
jgi:AraC-like DNA-binding protein